MGEGSASRPGRSLLPVKTRYPLYRRLGGPQGLSGRIHLSGQSPGLLSFNQLLSGLKFSLQRQKIYDDLRKINNHPLSLKVEFFLT